MNENAPKQRVDMHVHYDILDDAQSTYSLIDMAKHKGVVAIGLLAKSDVSPYMHDFIEYGNKIGVAIVPGAEYTTFLGNERKRADLICLGFDPDDIPLFSVKGSSIQNKEIALEQKSFLENNGFSFLNLGNEELNIMKSLLNGETSEKAIKFCEIISKSSDDVNKKIVQELKASNYEIWNKTIDTCRENEYYNSPQRIDAKFLYNLFFAVNRPGYLPVQKHFSEVVDQVHQAGGVVLYSPEGAFDIDVWKSLMSGEIDGIMAWHGGALGNSGSKLDIPINVLKVCRERGKLVLGGSDFQGKDWELGTGNGSMFINPKRYFEFIDYVKSRNDGKLPWVKK